METKTRFILLLLGTLLLASTVNAADSAQMRVSVQVIARTIVTVDQQPASVALTTHDVARGYVEVPSAVAFRVRSNARSGFSLQFEPLPAPFTAAQVTWGTTTVTVGSDGSWINQPYQQSLTGGTMSVRLVVAPGTSPGTYAWPVAFDANSL